MTHLTEAQRARLEPLDEYVAIWRVARIIGARARLPARLTSCGPGLQITRPRRGKRQGL